MIRKSVLYGEEKIKRALLCERACERELYAKHVNYLLWKVENVGKQGQSERGTGETQSGNLSFG